MHRAQRRYVALVIDAGQERDRRFDPVGKGRDDPRGFDRAGGSVQTELL
jgi:hypothetical protein